LGLGAARSSNHASSSELLVVGRPWTASQQLCAAGASSRALLSPLNTPLHCADSPHVQHHARRTGLFRGVPLSIVTTLMGMPNMDFVVSERVLERVNWFGPTRVGWVWPARLARPAVHQIPGPVFRRRCSGAACKHACNVTALSASAPSSPPAGEGGARCGDRPHGDRAARHVRRAAAARAARQLYGRGARGGVRQVRGASDQGCVCWGSCVWVWVCVWVHAVCVRTHQFVVARAIAADRAHHTSLRAHADGVPQAAAR
jgi:hypothetical protein